MFGRSAKNFEIENYAALRRRRFFAPQLRRQLLRTGMVVDYPPAVRKALEN
jgi:hypothetical protein